MRKKWLALIFSIVMILMLAACGSSGDKSAQSSKPATDGEKKFSGKTIRFVAANHPYPEAIKAMIPEFEKETGIKVNMESYFEDQLTQKLTVEMTSGSSTIDVFMNRPPQEGRLFAKNNWYEPLNKYINDPKVTPADWDWKDFPTPTTDAVTINNNICGIPIVTEWEMLFYRKDLFEKAGIKPPATMEELEAAAKKLHNPSQEMYGIVSRGQRGAAVTQFSSYLYGFGGDFIKGGKSVIDSPEAVKAIRFYGKILKEYGPPGVTNMSWPQAQALFASGKAAMWTDASTLLPGLIDKDKSKVSDKVGLAMFPAGPAGAKPYVVVPWSVAMSAQSKNKDAAWEFIKWLSNKNVMKKAQLAGNTTSRTSIWSDKEVIGKLHPGMGDIAKQTSGIGVPSDRPIMTAVVEARDAIGDVIVKSIESGGGDITAEAKQASQKVDDLLKKSGENK